MVCRRDEMIKKVGMLQSSNRCHGVSIYRGMGMDSRHAHSSMSAFAGVTHTSYRPYDLLYCP